MLDKLFSCSKLAKLFSGLLNSHEPFTRSGCGIPIGNVTSQHFANLYLSGVDRLAELMPEIHYIRYMDDMVDQGHRPRFDQGT